MKTKIFSFIALISFLSPFLSSAYAAETMTASSVTVPDKDYYMDTFVISAYYSPLPDQPRYVTGSYAGDIRLNGNGTHFADGTPVYPGGIAAPKIFAFGTVLDIPTIGVTKIHDRGGAIVAAGNRGYSHHRLDVWMGYGYEGMMKALQWGKRTVENVKVYGVREDIEASILLSNDTFKTPSTQSVKNNLFFGTESEEVQAIKKQLQSWGYYQGKINKRYDEALANALFNFQIDFDIVDSAQELGAGHFGSKTKTQFETLKKQGAEAIEKIESQRKSVLMSSIRTEETQAWDTAFTDNEKSEAVLRLQKELARLGYLRAYETSVYDTMTKHAVFKFQQAHGLVQSKNESAAGFFGPKTRETLMSYVEKRILTRTDIRYTRQSLKGQRDFITLPEEVIAKLED